MTSPMGMKIILLSAVLLSFSKQVVNGANTYRAAVVEYSPVIQGEEEDRITQNFLNFKTFMTQANAQKVDIIAFPEYGLWTRKTYSPIPEPAHRISPCDDKKFNTTKVVKDLSCAAKQFKIYTLVNLLEKRACKKEDPNCPKEGYWKYNTNVAFDRNGTVVGRYSKFNLYDEPVAQKPKVADISFFDTDFGVRFGLMTSFDIHFPVPGLKLIQQYKITDFILPCYWFSELPFLTALQIYKGWAETNNVNLLVPGLNYPASGTFGSGIYNGKNGEVKHIMPLQKTSQMIYADVPKYKKNSLEAETSISTVSGVIPLDDSDSQPENYDSIFFIRDQLNLFKSEVVKSGKLYQNKVCSNENFCCQFKVNYDLTPAGKNYTFRAMAFNGVRKFGLSFKAGVQVCAVVLCNGPDIMSCTNYVSQTDGLFNVKEIQIKGDFKAKNSFQIASTLVQGKNLEPLPSSKYKFTKVEKDKNMAITLDLSAPNTNLLSFGIWGRDFTKDV